MFFEDSVVPFPLPQRTWKQSHVAMFFLSKPLGMVLPNAARKEGPSTTDVGIPHSSRVYSFFKKNSVPPLEVCVS